MVGLGGSCKNLETSLMGDWTDNFGLLNGGTKIGRLDKKIVPYFLISTLPASSKTNLTIWGRKDFDSISRKHRGRDFLVRLLHIRIQ